MNPINFHNKLNEYSNAEDDIELIHMFETSPGIKYSAAEVSRKLATFIADNSDLFAPSDLKALENLAGLACQLEIRGGIADTGGQPTTLEKTIASAFHVIHKKMFHEKLRLWSESYKSTTLVNKILNKNSDGSTEDIIKASQILNKLIKENLNELSRQDLSALEKLKTLAQFLAIHSGEREQQITKTSLESTIDQAIKLIKRGSGVLPPALLSIVAGYSTLEDAAKLAVTQPLPEVFNEPRALSTKDMKAFLTFVYNRFLDDQFRDKEDSTSVIISSFFKHASNAQQQLFFGLMTTNDRFFLNHILSAIPKNITDLDFTASAAIDDSHVAMICQRFSNLQSFSLADCLCLTDTAVIAITKSSNMTSLQSLALSPNVTDTALLAVAN